MNCLELDIYKKQIELILAPLGIYKSEKNNITKDGEESLTKEDIKLHYLKFYGNNADLATLDKAIDELYPYLYIDENW